MKALITTGCKTDHGGIIVLGDSTFLVGGKAVHLEGMEHFCPKCKTTVSAILSGKGFLTVSPKTIIMAGDKASCGAVFLTQQNLVLRMSGIGKSRNADFETESISSSHIETSQLDLTNSLSRLSTKPPQLSEDNILLTAV